MLLVCRLKDIVSGDGRHFGGKADALAVLARAGMPVPEGIGIAAEAFEKETLGLSGEAEAEVFKWIRSQGAGARFAVRARPRRVTFYTISRNYPSFCVLQNVVF